MAIMVMTTTMATLPRAKTRARVKATDKAMTTLRCTSTSTPGCILGHGCRSRRKDSKWNMGLRFSYRGMDILTRESSNLNHNHHNHRPRQLSQAQD